MMQVEASDRRLPVYLLLDTSFSMEGEPITAVEQGVKLLVEDLQSDPMALETAWLSVITFDSDAKQVVPLTEIGDFQMPPLRANGMTSLGAALKLLMDRVDKEVRKQTSNQKGDWKPLIFLMTDGEPNDKWESPADEVRKRRLGNIIACAAGPEANERPLKRITEIVFKLQDCSEGTLRAFFKWVTASVKTTSASVQTQGDQAINLPEPPKDAGIVIVP